MQSIEDNNNALISAAITNHLDIVKGLLESGANVNHADDDGDTALIMAACKGHLDIVNVLLKRNDVSVNHAEEHGETALIAAAKNGNLEIVKALLKRADVFVNLANEDGWTALIWASFQGHLEIVKKLLEHNDVSVNHAEEHGHTALILASLKGHLDIVKVLLESGANVNHANEKGYTALTMAEKNNKENIVELLKGHQQKITAVQTYLRQLTKIDEGCTEDITHKIDSIESIGLQDSLLQILSSQQSPILSGKEKEGLRMYLELKRQNKDTSLLKNYLNLYHSLPHRSPELMERLVNMDSIELAGGGVIYITESIKGLAKRPYTLAALSLSQVITGIIQDESLFEPHRLSPNRTVLFSQDHNSKTTTECEKKQNPTSQ